MHQQKTFVVQLLFTLAFCLWGQTVQCAEGYPQPQEDYVNDFAGVMSQSDREAVGQMFKDLEYKSGIEATVVTIRSVRDYEDEDVPIETFAQRLFNDWGIGHKRSNGGVLLLVAVDDHACRIELGAGYGHGYDAVMGEVINEFMLPYFKNEEYSRGIFEGARAVVERVTKKVSFFAFYKWHILIALLCTLLTAAGISCMRSGKTGWGWAFFAAAGAFLLLLVRMFAQGKREKGFGGGSSSGGGATGKW